MSAGTSRWSSRTRVGEAAIDFAKSELRKIFGAAIDRHLVKAHFTRWGHNTLTRGSLRLGPCRGAYRLRSVLRRPVGDRVWFAGEACSHRRVGDGRRRAQGRGPRRQAGCDGDAIGRVRSRFRQDAYPSRGETYTLRPVFGPLVPSRYACSRGVSNFLSRPNATPFLTGGKQFLLRVKFTFSKPPRPCWACLGRNLNHLPAFRATLEAPYQFREQVHGRRRISSRISLFLACVSQDKEALSTAAE